nr:LysR family transcriptional regulator [Bacillus sp. SM2101]
MYRVFYITATEKSFSLAAKKMFLTQPSVSHSIKQLEEKLDTLLFVRTSKGVRLTKEGEMLFHFVEQAFHFIEKGEKKVNELKNLMSGEISIGSSDSLCKHYLLPHIKTFTDKYPQVQIQLKHGTTPNIIELLKKGKIDLGIVHLPIEDNQVDVTEFINIHSCFVVSSKYKKLLKNEVSLKELLTYPLITFSKNSSSRKFIEALFKKHDLTIEPEIELGSVDLLIECSKIGLGVGFVTKEFVTEELEQNLLYEVNLQEDIPVRKLGIVTLKNTPISVGSKKFIKSMKKKGLIKKHHEMYIQ